MSFLRKIRFSVIGGIAVDTPIYGYIETLVSIPVRDTRTGLKSEFTLAIYDIEGNRIDIQGRLTNSYWKELPHTAFIWNDTDFETALRELRELT